MSDSYYIYTAGDSASTFTFSTTTTTTASNQVIWWIPPGQHLHVVQEQREEVALPKLPESKWAPPRMATEGDLRAERAISQAALDHYLRLAAEVVADLRKIDAEIEKRRK